MLIETKILLLYSEFSTNKTHVIYPPRVWELPLGLHSLRCLLSDLWEETVPCGSGHSLEKGWGWGSLNLSSSLSAGFHKVMEGIHKAIELGYKPVKVRACHSC